MVNKDNTIQATIESISADTVVKSITVWNGNDKVNSIGRFSTGIANIAFTKVVTVPAGQTVKLPIKINVNNTDGIVASELRISLLEVKSDTALAGNFPMVGNAFTIATVDLGTIDVKKSGDAPSASVNAGDKNVRLAKFDFEVGYEAQTIKRIVFSQDGTAADTDLANLKLIDEDGTVLALAEMNKGELAFNLNKDCISGTTARLTIRGDVVGGAGRTVQFSVDNVNDVQSTGKIYNTTIVASGTAYGNVIEIDRGAFILTKASSSPAASTIATTVDDQKFAAIKVEAVGEPVQLETVNVALVTKDEVKDKKTDEVIEGETAVREVKLVSGGVVIASQEIKKNDLKKDDDGVAVVELPLNEVVTVEPHYPITLDILVDLKNAAKEATYEVGISKIAGTGLVSGKDVTIPSKVDKYDGDGELIDSEYEDIDITYGNMMTVGDVKITIEQKAQVDGYVFKNQSEETFAQFNIKHNLGERVRLSSITFRIDKVAHLNKNENGKDILENIPEVPGNENARTASSEDILKTFKGFHVVSADGKTISDTVNPTSGIVKISLDEGVIVEPGKTLKLGLVGDIRANAVEGDVYEIYATKAAAVTIETGTRVAIDESTFSREITITSGANSADIKASASLEKTLKNKNVLAEQKNVEIARWTIENKGKEDIGINKLYLTAHYSKINEELGKELSPANIQFMLKDGKGTVVSDWDDLKGKVKGSNVDIATEIKMLRDNNKSKFVVPAAKNDEPGKADLVLYANIEENAPIAGTISVALGKVGEEKITTVATGGEAAEEGYHLGPDVKYLDKVTLFEMTGTVSGLTQVVIDEYRNGQHEEAAIGEPGKENYIPAKEEIKLNVPKLIPGGNINDDGYGPTSTVAISKVIARSTSSSNKVVEYKDPTSGNLNEKVAEFYIKNNGPKQVGLSEIVLNVKEQGNVTKLELYKNDEVLMGHYTDDVADAAPIEGAEGNKTVKFDLAKEKIRLGANEEMRFVVRTEGHLSLGQTVHLILDKDATVVDNSSFQGYEIKIDNEDTLDLGSVTVKNKD